MTDIIPFAADVTDWIAGNYRRRTGEDPGPIDIDADLIESRILDSLSIMNFIAFLEELRGREILPSEIDVETLRTVRRICTGLLGKVDA